MLSIEILINFIIKIPKSFFHANFIKTKLLIYHMKKEEMFFYSLKFKVLMFSFLTLLFLPFSFAELCFGKDCPLPDDFENFIDKFDNYKSSIIGQQIPKGFSVLAGDQKINVKVNNQIFSLKIKNNQIVEMKLTAFSKPTLTAKMDSTTFNSILNSDDKYSSVKNAIYEGRIILEGNNFFNKLKSLGGKAYSYLTYKPRVELNPVACLIASDSDQTIKLKKAGSILIPEGTELIIQPFKVECEKDTELRLTLAVPKNYRNIQALTCKNNVCLPSFIEEVKKLPCGYKVQTKGIIKLTSLNVPPKESKIISNTFLQSGDLKIEVLDSPPLTMRVSSSKLIPEMNEPNLKLLGNPLIISVNKKVPLRLKVELPYLSDENIDPSSVSVYAYKDEKWHFLGGVISSVYDKVSVEIKDLSKYLSDKNQAMLALVGWVCETCKQQGLKKIYDPYTNNREAIVFVHGLKSNFDNIINDIILTHQPWQVYTFNYQFNDIQKAAVELANSLEDKLENVEKLHLVSHGLGGVVVQQSLNFAEQAGSYEFLSKVKNLILIGVPNKGFLNVNLNKALGLPPNVNIDLKGIGKLNVVKGINYQVIAGNSFENLSDGIVSLDSARVEGVNNFCSNYFEFAETHTGLLESVKTKEVVEKIIAKNLLEKIDDKAIMGNQKYYELNLDDCFNDKIAVVGVKEDIEKTPQVCGCGNGYCGWDEDEKSCYQDCGNILRKEIYCSKELLHIVLVLFILLLFNTFLVDKFTRKIKKRRTAFLIITIIALLLVLVMILINLLCKFKGLIFTLEVLLFLVFIRKLVNLWKRPMKMLKS